jgi:hypothetical protein
MNFDQNSIIETLQLMEPSFEIDNPTYCASLVIFQKLKTTLLNIMSLHCGSFYFVCTYVAYLLNIDLVINLIINNLPISY